MSKFIDLTGQKFGRFTVIKRVGISKNHQALWLCLCDCGLEKNIRSSNLRDGTTKSCGCLRKQKIAERSTKHGHTSKGKTTPTYQSWGDMIKRCTNPKKDTYQYYGGRGIKVSKKWRKFENFLKDMGEKPNGYTLDRIDNNKGYYPGNCHWVTSKQNNRNRLNNRYEIYEGKTQCIATWAEKYNISYTTLWMRLYKYGWSIEKALTTPMKNTRRKTNV